MANTLRTAVTQKSDTSSRATSHSLSSLERRACRICQSETGEMLRPCSCAGTMGDIHEHCLSTWVTMSQKKACEICHEEYQLHGERFKPLCEWTRPGFGRREASYLGVLIGLIGILIYMGLLVRERKMYQRCFEMGYPLRSDDLGRIIVISLITGLLGATIASCVKASCRYIKKQKQIHFANKQP